VGSFATHGDRVGMIKGVWGDEGKDGQLHVELVGPKFESNGELCPVDEVALGGTPDLYPPTLELMEFDTRAYETRELKEPDGMVPAGWAAFYKPGGVYVAWGLGSQQQARDIAIGHQLGKSFIASQF
jgi:hypothetical protein